MRSCRQPSRGDLRPRLRAGSRNLEKYSETSEVRVSPDTYIEVTDIGKVQIVRRKRFVWGFGTSGGVCRSVRVISRDQW